jgi:hypothetical protein
MCPEMHELLAIQFLAEDRLTGRIQPNDMEPHLANIDAERRNMHDGLPRLVVDLGATIISITPRAGRTIP